MREIYATNNALSAALHRRTSKIPKQKWEITAATDFLICLSTMGKTKNEKNKHSYGPTNSYFYWIMMMYNQLVIGAISPFTTVFMARTEPMTSRI